MAENRITAGLLAIVAKIGPKLLAVVAKLTKIGKVGLLIGSFASYSYLFSWKFAIMVLILLFVHESGHLWAMKRCGMKTKGIYFIPFLGAAAVTEESFKSRKDEVYVAIMGPIWGFLLSGFVALLYVYTKNSLFGAASGWMAMINLFNLLPINPLDGGRIMKSVVFSISSKLGLSFLIVGLLVATFVIYWAGIFLFFFLLIVGSMEFLSEYYSRNPDRIIKKSVKDLDKLIKNDPPDGIKNEAEKTKNILLDKKVNNITKIEKYRNMIIKRQQIMDKNVENLKQGRIDEIEDTEFRDIHEGVILSHLSYRMRVFDPIPRMKFKGIVISIISYIMISVVLWALMGYMNHIPEVEIARKLFMS